MLPALWAAVILVLTSWPSPSIPISGLGLDKVAHLGMYLVLGVLVGRALPARSGRSALIAAAIVLALFAALDEWHQILVPGRTASVWDWVADVLGILLGLLISHLLLSLAPTRRESTS